MAMNKPTRTCTIDDCDRKQWARGWCNTHYSRWHKHGDPTFVSVENYSSTEERFAARTEWRGDCLIWTGASSDGYGTVWDGSHMVRVHRYAWERINGPIPKGLVIDHMYHCDTLCVNATHLRLATRAENGRHKTGASRNSASGHRNVYPVENGAYRVMVRKDNVLHRFGTHHSLKKAIEVAESARRELFGEFAGKG